MSVVMKVKVLESKSGAKWVGYYGHKRRQANDEFILDEAEHFSPRWMKPIGWKPEGYVEGKDYSRPSGPESIRRTPLLSEKPHKPSATEKENEDLRKTVRELTEKVAALSKPAPAGQTGPAADAGAGQTGRGPSGPDEVI